jgi:uncharacterized protein
MNRASTRSILIAVIVLAVACAEQPRQREPQPPIPVQEAALPEPEQPRDEVARLLQAAAAAGPQKRISLELDAITVLLSEDRLTEASSLLAQVGQQTLSSAQWIRHSVLHARLDTSRGDASAALQRLDNPAIQAERGLVPRSLQVELSLARAAALEALGLDVEGARERNALQPWLSDAAQRNDNAQALFRLLTGTDMGLLEGELARAGSDDWRGWLELASVARDMRRGPAAQLKALSDWRQRYEMIAALEAARTGILPMLQEQIVSPARIALLLPLSGNAAASGQALLHGYLLEHMHQLAAGESPPIVAIIDTAASATDIRSVYAQAVEDGAELIIGPLLKDDLRALASAQQATVATIALNFDDQLPADAGELRMFGLDLADEVRQLANEASRRRFDTALVLSDGSAAAQRQVDELRRLWNSGDTRVLSNIYDGDLNAYRRELETSLLFEQSKARGDALARLIGMRFEWQPRRRADLDLILIFADPVAARSIRPLLSFLYAGDVPVWATSQAYGGRLNREEDRDLDSVQFTDMPWFSPAESTLRDSADGTSAATSGLQRLIALGVDAYRLQSRLGLLQSNPVMGLSGATGELNLDAQRRVRRNGIWYAFSDGLAMAVQSRPPLKAASTHVQSTDGETPWNSDMEAATLPADEPEKIEP